MEYLNLGCGSRYSTEKEWTNVDFASTGPPVIAHNLLKGIPFENQSFDLIYHSHVLEHFSKGEGEKFLKECFRVLKPGGIIRIAVPDLEMIAKEYLRNLELALCGNENANHDYDWIMLELYDQTVRNGSGGDMAKYILQKDLPNENYVFSRIGEEGRGLRMASKKETESADKHIAAANKKIGFTLSTLYSKIRFRLKNKLFKKEIAEFENLKKESAIGKFRTGGEIHQWMYDRYSLEKLLNETGFSEVRRCDAFTSKIPKWNDYELESNGGSVYKPDSLFMEATK